jgi:uncharacterized RDD family membrane protein YckC
VSDDPERPGSPDPEPRPPAGSPPDAPTRGVPAGLGRRVVAKFVDVLIVGIPLAAVGRLTGLETDTYGFSVLQAVVLLTYGALLESSTGATVGKRILRLTVRTESGAPPDLRAAAIRNGYWALQVIPPPTIGATLSLAAWLGIAISISAFEQHRGYHDRLAGTTVVRYA